MQNRTSITSYSFNIQASFEFVCLTTAHLGAVEDIAVDGNYKRVATVGGGSPVVWMLGRDGEYYFVLRSAVCVTIAWILGTLTQLAPQQPVPENFIARTVHFYDDGASIIVTYLESHRM